MKYSTRSRLRKCVGLWFIVSASFIILRVSVHQIGNSIPDTHVSSLTVISTGHALLPPRSQHEIALFNVIPHRQVPTTPRGRVPPTSRPQTTHNSTHVPLYSDTVLNPHPFRFLLSNKGACDKNASNDKNVFLLLLVKCRPSERFDRMQIRQTWGGESEVYGRRIMTMFLVGQTDNAPLDDTVVKEYRQHHDIIQENFKEHYKNLTYKTLMGFRWAAEICPDAEYVASMDADMMINVYNIVRRLVNKPRKKYAEGKLRSKEIPMRAPYLTNRKWLTSFDLYPEPTYAPFFAGASYVLSADVAADVFRESVHVRFLPWDDVFVGLVMKRMGVTPTHIRGYAQFVNITSDQSIESAFIGGQAVVVRHNIQKVDDRLINIWKKCVNKLGETNKSQKPNWSLNN